MYVNRNTTSLFYIQLNFLSFSQSVKSLSSLNYVESVIQATDQPSAAWHNSQAITIIYLYFMYIYSHKLPSHNQVYSQFPHPHQWCGSRSLQFPTIRIRNGNEHCWRKIFKTKICWKFSTLTHWKNFKLETSHHVLTFKTFFFDNFLYKPKVGYGSNISTRSRIRNTARTILSNFLILQRFQSPFNFLNDSIVAWLESEES